jgi:hypothetical protein
MHRIVPILAAAVLLSGCPLNGTNPGAPLTVTRITPEAPSSSVTTGLHDPVRSAVFDAQAFGELWTRAYSGRSPAIPPPAVDFTREFVVFTALGEHSTGGYGIEVARATGRGGHVDVQVVTSTPGKGCVVTAMMTQPLDVVRVARPRAGELDVRFTDELQVRDCK